MKRSWIPPLLIALLCITAIGISSTTLESSIATEPDEEIDLEYEYLPLGQEDAQEILDHMEDAADGDPDEAKESDPDESDQMEDHPEGGGSDESDQDAESQGPDDEGAEAEQGGGGGDGAGGAMSLLDRLLNLLALLLRALLPILIIVAIALAVRYREEILDRLRAMLGAPSTAGADEGEEPVTVDAWPDATPSNPVDEAWLTMVRLADPDRPAVMTTAECAAVARDAGIDSGTVETITTAFERVHYGGVPISTEEGRARRELQQLREKAGSEDGDLERRNGIGGTRRERREEDT